MSPQKKHLKVTRSLLSLEIKNGKRVCIVIEN